MPQDSIKLELVTPDRQVVTEVVSEIQIPGREGYLGVLPGHAPLLTELGVGELTYRVGGQSYYASVVLGFAEILPDRVIVLAERSERAEEIDVERARAARDRAEKRLASTGEPNVDWDRATFALRRALIRLQVSAKGGAVAADNEQRHGAS